MKTTYTLSEIKSLVNSLKYKSQEQWRLEAKAEFKKNCESNTEMEYDIKMFGESVKMIHTLIKKYSTNNYNRLLGMYYDNDSLYSGLEHLYIDSKKDDYKKINNQFAIIESRLKTIRNPDKAIEFLQLCGIELPAKPCEIKLDSPVDVDFIKSVLPKNILLSSGSESEASNE